ncbi:MAG: DNA recombination protein RmuC [Bacillota bacterium]|nr:DNA recombination protein RmuC [Thermoanaerobacteraceae bacterium]
METFLVFLMVLLLGAVLVVLYLQLRRPGGGGELAAALQNLSQAVQAAETRSAVLAEKVTHLEALPQTVGGVQLELRSLMERVSTVEQKQQEVGQGVQAVARSLAETGAATQGLKEMAAAIRAELSGAKEGLAALQAQAKARQELEQRTAESIRRLEAIIAGTHTKGAAGENILDLVFAKLPPEWQVRDFRVGNKVVEFGLRLPNGLVLPIDSKWPATALLEQFSSTGDPAEQQKVKKQIEDSVFAKAKEIKKYLEPNLTTGFGVVAVPDAVYDLCVGIHAAVFQESVVLVGYSMFLPYLLLVFQTILRTARDVDLERLNSSLETFQKGVAALQEELEGRFAKALTMLHNSRSEMGVHLSRISGSLTALQASAQAAVPGEVGVRQGFN